MVDGADEGTDNKLQASQAAELKRKEEEKAQHDNDTQKPVDPMEPSPEGMGKGIAEDFKKAMKPEGHKPGGEGGGGTSPSIPGSSIGSPPDDLSKDDTTMLRKLAEKSLKSLRELTPDSDLKPGLKPEPGPEPQGIDPSKVKTVIKDATSHGVDGAFGKQAQRESMEVDAEKEPTPPPTPKPPGLGNKDPKNPFA